MCLFRVEEYKRKKERSNERKETLKANIKKKNAHYHQYTYECLVWMNFAHGFLLFHCC